MFRSFDADSTILALVSANDIDYHLLYDSLKSSYPGFLENIFKKIDSRELDDVSAYNSSLSVLNQWQSSQKQTNQLYIDRWLNDDFSFSET